jgi:hypothetical protein
MMLRWAFDCTRLELVFFCAHAILSIEDLCFVRQFNSLCALSSSKGGRRAVETLSCPAPGNKGELLGKDPGQTIKSLVLVLSGV